MVVQWLRLCAPNAGGRGLIPGQGNRSHVLQLKRGRSKILHDHTGFPGGSEGKVSAYNVGDLGSIPGSGRSTGEGNYHFVFVVVQSLSHV